MTTCLANSEGFLCFICTKLKGLENSSQDENIYVSLVPDYYYKWKYVHTKTVSMGKSDRGSSIKQHAFFLPSSSILLAGTVYSTVLLPLPGEYKEDTYLQSLTINTFFQALAWE